MEIHLWINWAIFITFKNYWKTLFHIFLKYYTSQRSHTKIFINFGALNKSKVTLKFHKLLSNFHNNSKISKNKSCWKSKVLQLCFRNLTQIRPTFWNELLNPKRGFLRNFAFLNNFKFYYTTWKTPKTNFA